MRTVRRTLGALAVIASCCSILAAPAWALEPGVHVDPGSPAAHEYALPLGQARSTGGGSSTGEGATLFGAGIKPGGKGRGGGTGRGTGGSAVGAGGSGGTGGTAAGTTPAGQPPASVVRGAHDSSSDGSLLALIGGGVAILVLGGFGGTVLRHRRPRPTQ